MRTLIKRAQDLRRNMSEPERLLWSRLRGLRQRGFPMRRQAPFRGHILDFVCYSRRVAIEVDGGQHSDDWQADHDLVRDKQLHREGFTVLRFGAGEVRRNLDGVMDRIVGALEASTWAHAETKGWKGDPAARSLDRTSPP